MRRQQGQEGLQAVGIARQLGQFGAQAPQHAGKGARVGAVQHQHVGQRQQVFMALVAGTEGDEAVKQVQQHLDARHRGNSLLLHEHFQPQGHALQALEQAAHGEQAPTVVAGHAVGLRAGDGCQLQRQPVQRRQHLGQHGQFTFGHVQRMGEVFAHAAHQAPLLGRQAFAQARRTALQRRQVVGDAGALFDIAQRGQHRALEMPRRLLQRRHAARRQARVHRQHRHRLQHGQRRFAVNVDQRQRRARQAHHLFGALGVAAQPEKVLAGAAADGAVAGCDVVHLQPFGQHRKAVHRALGHDPGVQARAAALHRHTGVFALRHTGHATGQHVPAAVAFSNRIDTHQGRARRDRTAAPNGCARKAQPVLRGPGVGVFMHCRALAVARVLRVVNARGAAVVREGAAQHLVVQLAAHVLPRRRFTAPPGGQRRQRQRLVHQALGNAGQKALDGRRFKKGTPQRVGHHHAAVARGLQQAWHPERAVGAQFQRVAPVVVQPAQHTVHGFQPFDGLEEQALATHREVTAFHQRQAQVARQVGVFEVGLAVGARRQQHHARRVAAGHGGGALLQRVQQPAVAGGDALHPQFTEGVGELARDDEPVVQHVAQARRALRALRHQPPATVGATRQVKGDDQQPLPTGRLRANHRPQPARVAQQQRRGQQAPVQQRLRAVEVGQHLFQQFGALRHAGFNGRPVGRLDELRQQFQRPRPRRVAGLHPFAEDVVGDAVELDALRHLAQAAVEVTCQVDSHCRQRRGWRQRQGLRKTLPSAAKGTAVGPQFVPHPRLGRQGVAQQRVGRRARAGASGLEGQQTLRLAQLRLRLRLRLRRGQHLLLCLRRWRRTLTLRLRHGV